MDIDSKRFLAGTILMGSDVAVGIFVLVRHLNGLSFNAAFAITAGIILLVSSWLLALRHHRHISILLIGKHEFLTEKLVRDALSYSADGIANGVILTNIFAMMFLMAIGQILSGR